MLNFATKLRKNNETILLKLMSREDILDWLLIALMVLAPMLGELFKHLKKRFLEKVRPQMTVAERYRATSAESVESAPVLAAPERRSGAQPPALYGFTPEEEGGRLLDESADQAPAALSEADAERLAAHRRRWRQAVIDCEVLGRRRF